MKEKERKRKKRRGGEKGRRKKGGEKSPNVGIKPATSYSAAHVTIIELPPPGLIAHTIYLYFANLNFHDLTVAALALPIICTP